MDAQTIRISRLEDDLRIARMNRDVRINKNQFKWEREDKDETDIFKMSRLARTRSPKMARRSSKNP